jgi:peptidoglycan/xylan/chitin deacetylase (PgdA/CDA1 family)
MLITRRLHWLLVLLPVVIIAGCTRHAEPRWLVRALPGTYPDVVYFVPTSVPAVALTIDDGLDPDTTPAILDVLAANDASATFFLLSDSMPGNEHLLQRILDEGHEIGHHMTEDEVTVALSDEDLAIKFHQAADVLEAHAQVVWFRPGSGRYDDRILELTRTRGYRIAMASIAPLDTLISSPRSMSGFISWMAEPGSIIVLHDVDDRGRRTAATLERLLPILQDRGYRILSLSELDELSEAGAVDSSDDG